VRTQGTALCADPVGSGKTFVALAVARAMCSAPTACFVPASLVSQWEATARKLQVPTAVWSHSRLSLGRLPSVDPSFVIVDESHHFRRPDIQRYRTLAPWLVGRRVLLLSATPVVNRSMDLYHQLHLGLRDDALADDGPASLRMAFDRNAVPAALGRFVVQRLDTAAVPESRHGAEVAESGAVGLLDGLDALTLSSASAIAALVRTGLLSAAASSPAALLVALRRYRHLLLQALDSLAAGRTSNRPALRRLIGGVEEQLVFWSLMPAAAEVGELCTDDLPSVELLISEARRLADRPDPKSARLDALLANDTPTLVFVTARETINYLRHQLPDRWLAWCSGARAGIGGMALPRHEVLAWFRPDAAPRSAGLPGVPRTLITTDVTAEGLDLQATGRVVHYDLPWTDVRLAQRNGRAVRRGSRWGAVEIVRFLPAAAIETRLHHQAILLRKAGLPSRNGLGPEGRQRWRWRRETAEALQGPGIEGRCAICGDTEGALAGIALTRGGETFVSALLWKGEGRDWSDEPATVESRLRQAATAQEASPPSPAAIRALLTSLVPHLRALLRGASAHRVAGLPVSANALRLGRRLRALAARAARQREAESLARLTRALAFCAGGHTAGEAMLVSSLLSLGDDALLARLPGLPESPPVPAPLQPRLTGLIVFRREP
jgi:hypothetical protein